MNRRDLIAAVALLGVAPAGAARAAGSKALRDVARDAWLYGLPLIETARARSLALAGGRPDNRLVQPRDLTTARTQRIAAPDVDTLSSRTWIDLANGPVTLDLPANGDRYVSVALSDMFTNVFATLGSRMADWRGGTFHICGPGFSTGEPGTLRAPTPWVCLLIRTLVKGPGDLPAARAMLDRIRLDGPAGRTPATYPTSEAPWREYFAAVQDLIVESPPPGRDSDLFRRARLLGLRPGGGFDPSLIGDQEAADIEAGVAEARAALLQARGQGPVIEGWIYPKASLGDFGVDYLYRAQTAISGLTPLPPQEETCLRAIDGAGAQVWDSAQDWKLLFRGGGLPPVRGYWSLTLYEATPDGRLILTETPTGRHAIGDRTPGLVMGMDGSLEVLVSRNRPGGEGAANWLPAPSSRPFALVLRACMPDEAMLGGRWRAPPLTPTVATPDSRDGPAPFLKRRPLSTG